MPIQLLWGDDSAALERAIQTVIDKDVDPCWASVNVSRLDGSESGQARQALEEASTPPFGGGARVVVLQRSPFCNACPSELADRFETALDGIPKSTHLLLCNPAKPDGRLRTTKALMKRIKAGAASERSFKLPAVWDGAGQRQLVERTADELKLSLEPAAVDALIDAIGSDSARLTMELQKLALHADSTGESRIHAKAVETLSAQIRARNPDVANRQNRLRAGAKTPAAWFIFTDARESEACAPVWTESPNPGPEIVRSEIDTSTSPFTSTTVGP